VSTQLPDRELSAKEVFERVAPSVVVVELLDVSGKVVGFGSGVVVAPTTVVTNLHVLANGTSYRVKHADATWPAQLLRADAQHDLAELSVGGLDAPPAPLRDSSTLSVGERVFAIGAPEGLELTISEGLISGLRELVGFDRVIQTSAPISPGSSGGGLFDSRGRLVGITTVYLLGGQNLNFALPADWVARLHPGLSMDAGVGAAGPPGPLRGEMEFSAEASSVEQRGDWEGLLRLAQKLTAQYPESAAAWTFLASAHNGKGEPDKALEAAQQAVRLDPNRFGA
jgi:S1-C subfamily serine protease